MYQIVVDNEVLYDIRSEKRLVLEPKISKELNKSDSLTFILPSSNPCNITKLRGNIKVFKDNEIIFEGRSLEDSKNFYNNSSCKIVGVLDYFNDSIVRPFEYHNMSVKDFLQTLINNHNSQVDGYKQFKIGKVDVVDFDGEETLYRKSETYENTWKTIQNRLLDKLGGYLKVRYYKDMKYLDYLTKSGEEVSQSIEFKKNILDLNQYTKATDLATYIIPYGSKDDAGNYLTIKSVNNGLDYICSKEAEKIYGKIWRTVEFSDVTVASNLLTKAKQYLNECCNLALTIELSALDLSLLDSSIEGFNIGDYPLVKSSFHGLNKRMQINKMEIDLVNPSKNKLTLGDEIQGFTVKQLNINKTINNKMSKNNITTTNLNNDVKKLNKKTSDNIMELNNQKKFIIMGI
ncbi:phage tail spike protein [uncultured Clostridium sp.]|uniref:phage tail spike protein n=1 Tax=uncultured Clostridium sp. TaxID=59620 RepID=UPI0025EAA350|nr:phage tail spike protein [uncultured Clostridium sp.]